MFWSIMSFSCAADPERNTLIGLEEANMTESSWLMIGTSVLGICFASKCLKNPHALQKQTAYIMRRQD
jgi:hypothetical protein